MSFEFFTSFDWAPPVATQFSVLSYTTHTCVDTYIHTYIHTTYTHIFGKLGHRLWRFSFLMCHSTYIHAYTKKCVCFLFISLQHFSVHRLFATQFSVVRADCCQRAGGTDHSMPRDYIQQ